VGSDFLHFLARTLAISENQSEASMNNLENAGYVGHQIFASESPCLPPAFYNEKAEAAWLAVLGSRGRIKELAEKLRKQKLETPIPRKHWKTFPDFIVLGLCYGMPSFSQQLTKLVTPQQYHSMSPRFLTTSFVVDLLGTRIIELGEILSLGDHQQIKERICELLPQARPMFEQGWGASVYPGVLTLAYLLEIANFLEQDSDNYYKSCFALNTILAELLHTPILGLTKEVASIHPGYRDVYAGLSTIKDSIDRQNAADVANPSQLAISMSAALKELSIDVLRTTRSSVLQAHELLFSLSGPGQQGLKNAAEEFVACHIRPKLNWATSRVKDALRTAGIAEHPPIPDHLGDWKLSASINSITAHHFKVLQPLVGIEQQQLTDSWDEQIENITRKAASAGGVRHEISGLVTQTNIDPVRVTEAAGRLNGLTADVISLTNSLASEISNIVMICVAARDRWNGLTAELDTSVTTTAHLSDGASVEDKEMLEIALEENQGLRIQLQGAHQEIHQLNVKADALEHHQDRTYSGPVLDPELARKLVLSPASLTPVEVLGYIQHVGGQNVRILPSAWRSAEESERFELSERMLDLLAKLVFEYAPSLAEGRPDAEARELLGTNYSARESESVESNPSLRFERTFKIDDRDHYFCRHLLVGNDPGRVRGMRIHFDILDGIVIIAYAGKHLTVSTSN
jgi:hypothetical protein